MLIHGSSLSLNGHGILIRGMPSSGKSDVALQLIEKGATLISDDQTELFRLGESVMAKAPSTIQGLLEVRSIGILHVPFQNECRLSFVIDLETDQKSVERMPEPLTVVLLEITLPHFKLPAYDPSLSTKIKALTTYPLYHD